MKIRQATHDDIPILAAFGARLHAESPRFSHFGYIPAKCEAVGHALVDSPDGFVFVADNEGEIVGVFAGFIIPHFFSDAKTASDLIVFVAPEHRGGTLFVRLLRAFEEAVSPLVNEIVLGVSTEIHPEQTAGFYERLGYSRLGYTVRRSVDRV